MTEESFQEFKKIMKTASYWRTQIVYAKVEMEKWESLVVKAEKENRYLNSEAAKLNVQKYNAKYNNAVEMFSLINIPNHTLCQE